MIDIPPILKGPLRFGDPMQIRALKELEASQDNCENCDGEGLVICKECDGSGKKIGGIK